MLTRKSATFFTVEIYNILKTSHTDKS